MKHPVDLAVILVGMNTREYVRECLASLAQTEWGRCTHEIIYVDNDSKDDSVDVVRSEFPAVSVVANTTNVGFCRAANQGSALASARYLLHLNNDTVVYPDAIPQLMSFLEEHAEASVAGCRLLNQDLTDQWSARRFPGGVHSVWGRRSWLAKHFPEAKPARDYLFKRQLRSDQAFEVDWVGTPCLLVRSEMFEAVGGFPPDFYYWHEAIFCRRVKSMGGSVWVVPKAKVIHFEGKGGGARPYAVRRWHILDFHRGAYRFHVEAHRLPLWHPRRWFAAAGLGARASLLLGVNWLRYRVLQRPTTDPSSMPKLQHSPAMQSAVIVVCPICQGTLHAAPDAWTCSVCRHSYPVRDGAPDLIVGERYDVESGERVMCSEELTNRRTVEDFYVPLFRKLFRSARPRVLSLGCGVGADVEALCDAGFDAYGVDNGVRSGTWKRRKYPERLVMANGKHMPFADGTFDCVFCGCVFPHVGVDGDSYKVTPDFQQQRSRLAAEMARVLKPGGKVIASNPNRWFPFDIFHEHTADRFVMRPTLPTDPLLLSRADYYRLFAPNGCIRAEGLPSRGYWSFANSRRSLKGRVASLPVRALFRITSAIKPLRTSFLNPWIVVMIEKAGVQS